MVSEAQMGVIQTPRSCDRCFSLKTQCDLAEVCGRCRRLGLECTNVRPVRPKGRPRKLERPNEAPTFSEPCLAPLADLISRSLDQVSTRHLGPAFAAALLEHITSTSHGHGFYAALLALAPPTSSAHVSSSQPPGILADPAASLTPTLVCSLLSVALDLRQQSLIIPDQQSTKLNKDSLRARSLARIPQVSSRYESSVSDALSLLFFSYTWCFSCEHMYVSVRWAALARVIITDAVKVPASRPYALQDLEQRITDLVLREPQLGSRPWRDAHDALEEFYIFFPTELLKYDDIKFQYQAESMIWMHGLYIILYAGRDFLTILMDPNALSDETLRHALGHSLLLGEVLPVVDRLGGGFEFVSPALLFFVLVSSAIQIATLGKYLPDLRNETTMTNTDFNVPPSSPTSSVPAKLVESSRMHLQIVSAIRSRSALCLDVGKLKRYLPRR
ncbi:hypothetical protein ACJ41O_014465 [Fusarium nematophilum]